MSVIAARTSPLARCRTCSSSLPSSSCSRGMGYPLFWQIVTSMQEYGLAQQFGQPAPFIWFENFVDAGDRPAALDRGREVPRVLRHHRVPHPRDRHPARAAHVGHRQGGQAHPADRACCWPGRCRSSPPMTIWIWLFDRRRGAINYLLDMIPGVEMNRFDWLSTPFTFFAVASIIVIWMSVPFVAFSIYAGLTQVSDEVLEAAQLDGASGWQRFWGIIAPMIRPVIAIVLLLQLIWDLRVFTQFKLLQEAGSMSGDVRRARHLHLQARHGQPGLRDGVGGVDPGARDHDRAELVLHPLACSRRMRSERQPGVATAHDPARSSRSSSRSSGCSRSTGW